MANILIIEDEISIQKVMKANLEANGHTVLIAGNGEEGIQSMRDTVPDIVLLDLLMPEMSGWDVLRTMRADKGLERIPVIVVTASIGSLTEKKARQLGVTDYLLKPFDLDDLLKTVKNVLKE